MAAYARHPGERHGANWYIPNVSRSSEFRHVAFDANSWKTFVHARLGTAAGDRGAMTLFGKTPEHHALFAEHVAESEYYVITEGQGRTVDGPRVESQAVQAGQPLAGLPGRLRRGGVDAGLRDG